MLSPAFPGRAARGKSEMVGRKTSHHRNHQRGRDHHDASRSPVVYLSPADPGRVEGRPSCQHVLPLPSHVHHACRGSRSSQSGPVVPVLPAHCTRGRMPLDPKDFGPCPCAMITAQVRVPRGVAAADGRRSTAGTTPRQRGPVSAPTAAARSRNTTPANFARFFAPAGNTIAVVSVTACSAIDVELRED